VSELDGIVDQIQQDLADASRVAQQRGRGCIRQDQFQFQVLFQGASLE
jgi:hypothetical protein